MNEQKGNLFIRFDVNSESRLQLLFAAAQPIGLIINARALAYATARDLAARVSVQLKVFLPLDVFSTSFSLSLASSAGLGPTLLISSVMLSAHQFIGLPSCRCFPVSYFEGRFRNSIRLASYVMTKASKSNLSLFFNNCSYAKLFADPILLLSRFMKLFVFPYVTGLLLLLRFVYCPHFVLFLQSCVFFTNEIPKSSH